MHVRFILKDMTAKITLALVYIMINNNFYCSLTESGSVTWRPQTKIKTDWALHSVGIDRMKKILTHRLCDENFFAVVLT